LPHPIEAIKFRMEQMGWSQADLARLTGYSQARITEYLHRKRRLTLAFIRAYHAVAPATPLEVLIQEDPLPTKRGK
jgi:HTH-type transcriptional regulator/antitoxin HigA